MNGILCRLNECIYIRAGALECVFDCVEMVHLSLYHIFNDFQHGHSLLNLLRWAIPKRADQISPFSAYMLNQKTLNMYCICTRAINKSTILLSFLFLVPFLSLWFHFLFAILFRHSCFCGALYIMSMCRSIPCMFYV